MQWVLWMIAVAVLGLAAVAASGRLGELPGTVTDSPRPHVPTGLLSGDDLRGLRFAVVPRGYSMDQVDELLDRLARQLDQRPAEDPDLETPAGGYAADDATSAAGHLAGDGGPNPGSTGVADEPTLGARDTQFDDAADPSSDAPAGDDRVTEPDVRARPWQPGADEDQAEPTAVHPAGRRDHDAPAGGSRPTVGQASPQSGIMDEVSPQTERG